MGTRAAFGRARRLHLIGLGLVVLLLATLGPASATTVEGKDWTPQIKVTRGAQIYWESLMRAADADLRGLRKAQRQERKRLQRLQLRRTRMTDRRGRAKRSLERSQADLADTRAALAAITAAAAVTSTLLLAPPGDPTQRDLGVADAVLPLGLTDASLTALGMPPEARPEAQAGVPRLERAAKQAKRSFKQARRKARRASRHVGAARTRLASLKAAERAAITRREVAERNLGAWIGAMTRYGRIRASKKSKARPGVNSSFVWPARGRVSQYYHGGHDGLDIVSYSGAPIRAAAFGVVTYVGWNPWDKEGRAFMVVVTHAGRYETAYGHLLPRRTVRVGQEVRKGEVVGYMGNTGKSTGTHLHFELRRGRSMLNPIGFL